MFLYHIWFRHNRWETRNRRFYKKKSVGRRNANMIFQRCLWKIAKLLKITPLPIIWIMVWNLIRKIRVLQPWHTVPALKSMLYQGWISVLCHTKDVSTIHAYCWLISANNRCHALPSQHVTGTGHVNKNYIFGAGQQCSSISLHYGKLLSIRQDSKWIFLRKEFFFFLKAMTVEDLC